MTDTARSDEDDRPTAWLATALQDELLTVSNDLDRLQTLLAHACDTLMARFCSASSLLDGGAGPADARDAGADVQRQLAEAVTALQFQDMASQLIGHTQRRLRGCADRLGVLAFGGDDEDGEAVVDAAPQCANPVTQGEMHAGEVELF